MVTLLLTGIHSWTGKTVKVHSYTTLPSSQDRKPCFQILFENLMFSLCMRLDIPNDLIRLGQELRPSVSLDPNLELMICVKG